MPPKPSPFVARRPASIERGQRQALDAKKTSTHDKLAVHQAENSRGLELLVRPGSTRACHRFAPDLEALPRFERLGDYAVDVLLLLVRVGVPRPVYFLRRSGISDGRLAIG